MSGFLQSVAEALPIAAAGFAGDPAQTMQVIEWSEKQKKERNLRAFGKEIFGSGDPKSLTPERIYQAAQKYQISPEEATHLTMNFLAFKKTQRGDPRLVSVPMPDGRFRSTDVYENEMPQFLQQNPGAVQGQVYGQRNDPLEPYQIEGAKLQNQRMALQNQYMPKEQEAGLQAQALQNQRMQLQNRYMPQEYEAGLTGTNLSNQAKAIELENMKLGPEKEQKTVGFLNEIFSMEPTKRNIEVLYKTGAKYGLSPKEVQTAMMSASQAQKAMQAGNTPAKDPNALTRKDVMTRVEQAYKPLLEAALVSGTDAAQKIQMQYQQDLQRAYNGETPLIFSGQTQKPQQTGSNPADPWGLLE